MFEARRAELLVCRPLGIESAVEQDVAHPRSPAALESTEKLDEAFVAHLDTERSGFVEGVGETGELLPELEAEIIDGTGPEKAMEIARLPIGSLSNRFIIGEAHTLVQQTLTKDAAPYERAVAELTIEPGLVGSVGDVRFLEHFHERLFSRPEWLATGAGEVS
jgi:hypothetical protein